MTFFAIALSFASLRAVVAAAAADVSHSLDTMEVPAAVPPRPYSFQYQAGRFPGHVDRVHEETADGSGTIRGSYSFVDPKHKVRTVEYVADKSGFHASLINYEDTLLVPSDSRAVKLAKRKHLELYNKIANNNIRGGDASLPKDTTSVEKAKNRHFQLYQRIAHEHAAIAAQRERDAAAGPTAGATADDDKTGRDETFTSHF